MKKICLLLFIMAGVALPACAGPENPQEFLNAIHKAIEESVGAVTDDQIPGYSFGDDHVTLHTGGIQCKRQIADVKQAAELLKAKLTSTFTTRIVSIRVHTFPPGDDTVLMAKLQDKTQAVTASVTIFKRSSSRVILLPVLMSKKSEQ